MSRDISNSMNESVTNWKVLASVIGKDLDQINPDDAHEYQAILDDQAVWEQMNQEFRINEKNWFIWNKNGEMSTNAGLQSSNACVFRSDSIGIVYSDIVALEKNCVVLELRNERDKTRLNVEPGIKNTCTIDISLYKESGLVEKIKLQKRLSWDLDDFEPGNYELLLGKKKSFQFVIQE